MTPEQVKELVERLTVAAKNNRAFAERGTDACNAPLSATGIVKCRAVADMHEQAASALTLLSEEREELREALRPFAEMATDIEHAHAGSDLLDVSTIPLPLGDLRRARAALKEGS
jgi:hypothetical protein